MKYSSKTETPLWFSGKREGLFAGWIRKDIDGWFKFYPEPNTVYFPSDLTEIVNELDRLNNKGG